MKMILFRVHGFSLNAKTRLMATHPSISSPCGITDTTRNASSMMVLSYATHTGRSAKHVGEVLKKRIKIDALLNFPLRFIPYIPR